MLYHLLGNAGHVLPLGEIWKARLTGKRFKPMNDTARSTLTWRKNGFKRRWNLMHMIKRTCLWTCATNIYQQIFASRVDVEHLPNLEVSGMKAMCSADWFIFLELIIWILVHWCSFVCFGQCNASCSCTLHRACLWRHDLRNLAPCGMWYVGGTISSCRARYAHLWHRAKCYSNHPWQEGWN